MYIFLHSHFQKQFNEHFDNDEKQISKLNEYAVNIAKDSVCILEGGHMEICGPLKKNTKLLNSHKLAVNRIEIERCKFKNNPQVCKKIP